MEHETLFTATKWDILKLLEQGAHSPLEISKALGSSLANISQQLRLLEMAGLVKTRRIPNRDKEKPRMQYMLAGNLSYLISTSDSFVDKRFMALTQRNKVTLRIWFLDQPRVRYVLEKAFWQVEHHLDEIRHLSYVGEEGGVPVLEYSGTAKLPDSISTGDMDVRLRKASESRGYVIYGP